MLNIKTDEPDPELNLYKEYYPENGRIMLSDRPGLGLEYDESELNKVIKIVK